MDKRLPANGYTVVQASAASTHLPTGGSIRTIQKAGCRMGRSLDH